jgi:hypothetical protein
MNTDEVIRAYEAWDPESESVSALVDRLGISKARLYQILEKEGITPKARRPRGTTLAERGVSFLWVDAQRSLLDEITERGVRSLFEELEELRDEVAEYRKRYGPLK